MVWQHMCASVYTAGKGSKSKKEKEKNMAHLKLVKCCNEIHGIFSTKTTTTIK